jgi:hypothetical protein
VLLNVVVDVDGCHVCLIALLVLGAGEDKGFLVLLDLVPLDAGLLVRVALRIHRHDLVGIVRYHRAALVREAFTGYDHCVLGLQRAGLRPLHTLIQADVGGAVALLNSLELPHTQTSCLAPWVAFAAQFQQTRSAPPLACWFAVIHAPGYISWRSSTRNAMAVSCACALPETVRPTPRFEVVLLPPPAPVLEVCAAFLAL